MTSRQHDAHLLPRRRSPGVARLSMLNTCRCMLIYANWMMIIIRANGPATAFLKKSYPHNGCKSPRRHYVCSVCLTCAQTSAHTNTHTQTPSQKKTMDCSKSIIFPTVHCPVHVLEWDIDEVRASTDSLRLISLCKCLSNIHSGY